MCQDPDRTTDTRNSKPGPDFQTQIEKNKTQTGPDRKQSNPDRIQLPGPEKKKRTELDRKKSNADQIHREGQSSLFLHVDVGQVNIHRRIDHIHRRLDPHTPANRSYTSE